MVIDDVDTALDLLRALGAPHHLVRHHELVSEAAQEIVDGLKSFGAHFDARLVLTAAALHDAGKIDHPNELSGPGNEHEARGREILMARGAAELARFCVTHARWRAESRLEDLLVALADKLWKGKRVEELERRVIEGLASASGLPFWEVFTQADDVFERVANGGDERLTRSMA